MRRVMKTFSRMYSISCEGCKSGEEVLRVVDVYFRCVGLFLGMGQTIQGG